MVSKVSLAFHELLGLSMVVTVIRTPSQYPQSYLNRLRNHSGNTCTTFFMILISGVMHHYEIYFTWVEG